MRNINTEGLSLIKSFEGLKLKAYVCPAGVLTIGYGSTGKHVTRGMVITEDEAENLLRDDLERFEQSVSTVVRVPLSDNQFAALVSLAFNIGTGAFAGSTLVRKLNAADYAAAAEQFLVWKRGGGKVLPGLERRRQAERKLFLTGTNVSKVETAKAKVLGLFTRKDA